MKKLKTTIKIKIEKITVDNGYYYINYEADIDGKKRTGVYDGDYDSQTAKEFEKKLQNGYALEVIKEFLF